MYCVHLKLLISMIILGLISQFPSAPSFMWMPQFVSVCPANPLWYKYNHANCVRWCVDRQVLVSDRPFCMYLGVRQTMTPAVTTFKRYNACVRYTNGVKYGSHRGREGPLVNQGRIFDDPLGSQSILEGVDDSRRRRSGTVHVVFKVG
ncbi:hypothetical protein B0I72DRAFT_128508 [Yarrowia lipolytica]|uniref:Uncharacterized protein n=1 Tax=Yarrowia lipolytica TaxID=4952 RepID=A0A371C716_YARLL|nr:hypothetical protein B0I71DRAFT_140448 [Yarrowia lipolytica]RDW33069.1 hypothetical protein B0I72DRAFT_128508 [Yarrowia lipolytica]RDW39419.1 hypothetical protein B0I73DRAFT_140959 [Yarrowia lipolytica]RDW45399.1 hypothetical protein B0I74DRAFT_129278 [Yarrowia lipolytica]RDW52311.1 hypothetical protein B0I75DRAFT_128953 [Yarrowia lipolytica]